MCMCAGGGGGSPVIFSICLFLGMKRLNSLRGCWGGGGGSLPYPPRLGGRWDFNGRLFLIVGPTEKWELMAPDEMNAPVPFRYQRYWTLRKGYWNVQRGSHKSREYGPTTAYKALSQTSTLDTSGPVPLRLCEKTHTQCRSLWKSVAHTKWDRLLQSCAFLLKPPPPPQSIASLFLL